MSRLPVAATACVFAAAAIYGTARGIGDAAIIILSRWYVRTVG